MNVKKETTKVNKKSTNQTNKQVNETLTLNKENGTFFASVCLVRYIFTLLFQRPNLP